MMVNGWTVVYCLLAALLTAAKETTDDQRFATEATVGGLQQACSNIPELLCCSKRVIHACYEGCKDVIAKRCPQKSPRLINSARRRKPSQSQPFDDEGESPTSDQNKWLELSDSQQESTTAVEKRVFNRRR